MTNIPTAVQALLSAAGFSTTQEQNSDPASVFSSDGDKSIDASRELFPNVTQNLSVYLEDGEVVIDIDTIFEGTIENEDGDSSLYLDDFGSTPSRITEDGPPALGERLSVRVEAQLKEAITTLNFDKAVAIDIMDSLRNGSAPQSLKELFKEYGVKTKLPKVRETAKDKDQGR